MSPLLRELLPVIFHEYNIQTRMTISSIRHWIRDLFRYPTYRSFDPSYDEYWTHRDVDAVSVYQRRRARMVMDVARDGDSVLDVGCGDGRMLAYIRKLSPNLRLFGIDNSPSALGVARSRGLHVDQIDLLKLTDVEMHADIVTLFEVIEHFADSERLLAWAVAHARNAVLFSVPNSGFFTHRLRLLLGRFPLQWRAHPSEHLRFWTLRDMEWWLRQLDYEHTLIPYEGVPILNRMWPSLFAEGVVVVVRPRR